MTLNINVLEKCKGFFKFTKYFSFLLPTFNNKILQIKLLVSVESKIEQIKCFKCVVYCFSGPEYCFFFAKH